MSLTCLVLIAIHLFSPYLQECLRDKTDAAKHSSSPATCKKSTDSQELMSRALSRPDENTP